MPGVRRRTTRSREISSRKPQARRETPRREPAKQEGRRGRVERVVRIGVAQNQIEQPRHITWGREIEVARSATENDAAAGEF